MPLRTARGGGCGRYELLRPQITLGVAAAITKRREKASNVNTYFCCFYLIILYWYCTLLGDGNVVTGRWSRQGYGVCRSRPNTLINLPIVTCSKYARDNKQQAFCVLAEFSARYLARVIVHCTVTYHNIYTSREDGE